MANRRYYGGTGDPYSRQGRGGGTSRFKLMLIIGVLMAGFQAFKYYTNTQTNSITGEEQRVQWTAEEEVPFDFHLLADDRTVNAFALPGGQCFITAALYAKLKNEDQLAGVLGHEIGHVIHRHGAERMASQGFIQGLIQSVMIGSGGSQSMAQIANMVGNYTSMKYGRDQELESDDFGVRLMMEAGYAPENLIGVMDILEAASGGSNKPEFQSTHPSPENRRQMIKDAIEKYDR